jgi:hypothetical protein
LVASPWIKLSMMAFHEEILGNCQLSAPNSPKLPAFAS